MTARLLLLGITVALLAGCDATDRQQTLSREHDAKAAQLCKKDKGLKRVIDINGANFTAECNSGIIVTGSAD
ncbi:MAG: hypothetical protein KGZ83_19615 [Sulfuricella sp.]|nr:hypothetical protein [Sulfuricella sp.]